MAFLKNLPIRLHPAKVSLFLNQESICHNVARLYVTTVVDETVQCYTVESSRSLKGSQSKHFEKETKTSESMDTEVFLV